MRRSMKNRATQLVSAGIAVAFLAGCGGSSSADSGGGADEFSFAMGASGAQGAFYEEALMRANEEYGYSGKWVELSGSEVAVSGVASNEFQFGAGVASTVMVAQQEQDAPLTFVGNFMRNTWTLTATSDIQSCEDLDGKRVGLHSPGGVSSALYKAWFASACPDGTKPQILYVEGSPNRLQGMNAGQLDATMLEIDDTVELEEDTAGILVNFSQEMPQIETNTIYSNDEFLEKHPKVAVNLFKEISRLAVEINEDPTVFADIIKDRRPELAGSADANAKATVEADAFAEDGGMTKEDLEETIKLYELADAIEPGLKFDAIADRQYLEEALASASGE